MPQGPARADEVGHEQPRAELEELDAAMQRSQRASLLSLDGAEHARLRRAVTSRFSVRQVRSRRAQLSATVAEQLAAFVAAGSPGDVWRGLAQPVAARTHCQVLGVPEDMGERFVELFVTAGTMRTRFEFIREVLARRDGDPGEDVVTDLLASDVVSREEVEGLLHMLMSSGRDSVAYMVATAVVALLQHPDQLRELVAEPARVPGVVEELMRTGSMFLTLFPRTANEDVEIAGTLVPAGTTVSVSPVAANRDPRRWDAPEELDLGRDAFGHLGFGHGIHGCIGQQLARVEISEVLTQLVTTIPGLRLVHAEQLEAQSFAHPVATYEAGAVLVAWDQDRREATTTPRVRPR